MIKISLIFYCFFLFFSDMSDTRNVNWCILIRNYFRVNFETKKSAMLEFRRRENVLPSVSFVKESLDHWSDSFFYTCRAHGSVHDEIRRGMLYQARSRWKLCFAVCSSVRSGADINLTLYEVYLKSSANASAKQRQMTFAENWILTSRCNITQRVIFEKRSNTNIQ